MCRLIPYVCKATSLVLLFCISIQFSYAQVSQNHWTLITDRANAVSNLFSELPQSFEVYQIDVDFFKANMRNVEQEIWIPDPIGNMVNYIVRPTQVTSNEVITEYTIQTFRGYQKDNPQIMIACDVSDNGFNAAIYRGSDTYFVTPASIQNPDNHFVYFKKDLASNPITCLVNDMAVSTAWGSANRSQAPNLKRVYRLAIAASGEYAQQFGGSPYSDTNVLNALASGVNMINPIYLRDIGVEFILVSTSALIWSNPNTDPFDASTAPWNQAHSAITNAIGSNAFDVGHLVMWANTGGAAASGICNNNSKGVGFSGTTGSITTLWIDYVCHEIGHQFGMPHNFSNTCGGNVAGGFRYEVGEGSSIMCYAGVCGTGYQNFSDPFFHIRSINAAHSTINNSHNCITNTTTTGNSANPIADAKSPIVIPKETPFILVGSATDGNDLAANLTYHWEQDDGNGTNTSGSPNCNNGSNSPNFRFREPVQVNYRNFPDYQFVINGNNNGATWEKLPCTSRTMDFSLTIRDNNVNWGRTDLDVMQVTVSNTGPFNVTSPNGGETLSGNTMITWSVNGTDTHCALVDILLSLDGGNTYTVVANGVPNDGSEIVALPAISNGTARILVRCDVPGGFRSTSTFYDVSDNNFIIDPIANNCPPNLTLTGSNTGGDYETDGTITSTQMIPSGSVVDYDAATHVLLNPDFVALSGSTFCAFIDGCGGNQ